MNFDIAVRNFVTSFPEPGLHHFAFDDRWFNVEAILTSSHLFRLKKNLSESHRSIRAAVKAVGGSVDPIEINPNKTEKIWAMITTISDMIIDRHGRSVTATSFAKKFEQQYGVPPLKSSSLISLNLIRNIESHPVQAASALAGDARLIMGALFYIQGCFLLAESVVHHLDHQNIPLNFSSVHTKIDTALALLGGLDEHGQVMLVDFQTRLNQLQKHISTIPANSSLRYFSTRMILPGALIAATALGVFFFLSRPVEENSAAFTSLPISDTEVESTGTPENDAADQQEKHHADNFQTYPPEKQSSLPAYQKAMEAFVPLQTLATSPQVDPAMDMPITVSRHASEQLPLHTAAAETVQNDEPEELHANQEEIPPAVTTEPEISQNSVQTEEKQVFVTILPKMRKTPVNTKNETGVLTDQTAKQKQEEWKPDFDAIIKEIEKEMASRSSKSEKLKKNHYSGEEPSARGHQRPQQKAISLTAKMDEEDRYLLNKYFENSESHLYISWGNRKSEMIYEIVLEPGWRNSTGAPCRNATVTAWAKPQTANTKYYRQEITGCRDPYARWAVR